MSAIGVFDSGYGGLTVLKEFINLLPEYDFIYFGDNARAPYGTRSFDVVYEYTLEAVEELFKRNCPLVILACNTASAKALRTIQQNDLPKMNTNQRVLGVIRPSAEIIGELSETKHIGLLATEGTVKSNSYGLELEKLSPEIQLYQHACPMWVPLIENGEHTSKPGRKFIRKDVERLLEQSDKIDTIILACTHYPIVENYLRELIPSRIKIISQGEIVAKSLVQYLKNHPEIDATLSKNGKVDYFTSGDIETFDSKAKTLIGLDVESIQIRL